ncbi:MAG: NAD(P)/FAD-dependent oxidoreductase [Acidobacteriota bacterium]|nr:NAD(P)/FAD-dependent oxidoreductase [Acidobacteriota bacterium]
MGAGAAGMFCAAEAGKRGRRVALLEHAEKPGKKILISGGGRCNFTNRECRAENFLSENEHFAKSALARYTPGDFIKMVDRHGIPWHEKTLGQLFCDRSARDITRMLEEECRLAGVAMLLNRRVEEVTRGFTVRTEREEVRCQAVVVATGGASIPKMGATGFGYQVAKQFGLRVVTPEPALVPLVFADDDRQAYCGLSGVSTEVIARCGAGEFREKMLVTHRGLSGPAILQVSSYWRAGEAVRVEAAPDAVMPRRLAARWAPDWQFIPAGTEGFEKAEVTRGGVDTAELSGKTFEARGVPGLYFVGEVVDVTGWLGGYNFQWAWSSGWCAGQYC